CAPANPHKSAVHGVHGSSRHAHSCGPQTQNRASKLPALRRIARGPALTVGRLAAEPLRRGSVAPAAAPEGTSKSAVPRRITRAPALTVGPLAVESLRRGTVAPAVALIAESILYHLEKSTSDTPEIEVTAPRAGTAQTGPESARA